MSNIFSLINSFKFIRITHASFAQTTTASEENRRAAIDCANRILLKCGYLIQIPNEVTTITLTDEEYREYLENNSDTAKYGELFRRLVERSRDSFSSDCINIVLTAHGRSLGDNSLVNTGVGGLVTGTPGVKGLPRPNQTPPDALPRHAWLPEVNGINCHTLAHELAHILCLEDQYDKFTDIFPPDTTNGSRRQRASESYQKALEWKQAWDREVRARMNADNIDEKEARKRVREGLSDDDKIKWDRVNNLMALGDELSKEDCERMLRCIRNHRQWQSWKKSAGE